VEDGVANAAVATVTTYERTWDAATAGGASIPHRLTVTINPATQLPERMVLSQWNQQGEWECVTTTVFEYLEVPQMDKALTELLAAK